MLFRSENSGEILISSKVASDGGVSFKVGDTLSLSVGNRMDGDRKLSQGDPYAAERETFVPQAEKTYTAVSYTHLDVYKRQPLYRFPQSPECHIYRRQTFSEIALIPLFPTTINPRASRAAVTDIFLPYTAHTASFPAK